MQYEPPFLWYWNSTPWKICTLYSNVITNIAFMIATILPIKLFVIINLLFKKYEKCRHIEEIKKSYYIYNFRGRSLIGICQWHTCGFSTTYQRTSHQRWTPQVIFYPIPPLYSSQLSDRILVRSTHRTKLRDLHIWCMMRWKFFDRH